MNIRTARLLWAKSPSPSGIRSRGEIYSNRL